MVGDLVIGALFSFVEFVVGLLPDVTLPYSAEIGDFADFVGSQIGGLNSFLPIDEMLPLLSFALLIYMPFTFVFYIVRYVYSLIPVFGRST